MAVDLMKDSADLTRVHTADPDSSGPLLCRTLDHVEEFGQREPTFRAKLLQLAAATAATLFMFWWTNRHAHH